MRVLVDLGHPAHVHFFRNPVRLLTRRGHEVLITSRDKEMAVELLDELGLPHRCLSAQRGAGLAALGKELLKRNWALWKVVRQYRPQVMAAIGGVNIAHVGWLTRIPSLVFYDTENARLQNAITYPLATCIFAPRCYEAWLPRRRHVRYDGYHELSYLRDGYFVPDRQTAIENGLAPADDTFFIRLVSWKASHDVGERGWNHELLQRLVRKLDPLGKILISAEGDLPEALHRYCYAGRVSQVHHVMACSRAVIGESATMASEAAVLGVPAIYAATTGRGYTNEQEHLYQLVTNVRVLRWEALETAVDRLLAQPPAFWQAARQRLLANTIDVAAFVADAIETFPEPLRRFRLTAPG